METLNVVSEADRFNEWMYTTIKPFCTGKVLEIGSGIGNISNFFIQDGSEIDLSELRENYITILQKKFADRTNVKSIYQMDILDPDFDSKFHDYFNTYDSIFALNIIEHLENDLRGIANCNKLLKPGGHLVILVPAYQSLFNTFDKALMHYRRYTKESLKQVMAQNELDILHQQYFNLIGTIGWWINGNLLKKKIIPGGQMKLYNSLVPLFKIIDKITCNSVGLSVITIGRKPEDK